MAEEQGTGNVATQDDATQTQDDASAVAAAAKEANIATQDATKQDDASVVADLINKDTGNPALWNFAEGVEGKGEIPEWFKGDKYKTVSDQAKAYKDLESKFGSFTGSPEEYTPAELSQELKDLGVEINQEDPLIEKALAFAKETNMNQEGFNQMVNLYAETIAAENMALETLKTEQMTALGNSAESRISNLNDWANANLSAEMVQGFQGLAQSADAVKTLERLVAMTRSAPISTDKIEPNAGGITAEEVKAMQFEKDENGNRRLQTDPEFRKKFREISNRVHGTADHVTTIG